MNPLFGVTNDTGYIGFTNVTVGSYTFSLAKQGYDPMNASLSITNQPMVLTITLLGGNAQSTTAGTSILVTIAVIIVILAAASGASVVLLLKRKSNAKVRKLRELQQQLKQK
jgi:hypothetical protein